MPDERFVIEIILDAQSKVAPVFQAIETQAEKMQVSLKKADGTINELDKHLVQLDGHLTKARDTLRSMNPTLQATDSKFKGLSETLTGVNRNMGTLERASAKAGAALGGLATLVDRIEKKLEKLDAKMTEMGTRTYSPKIELDDDEKTQARVDALLLKLGQLDKKKATAQIGIDQEIFQREIDKVEKELKKLGAESHLIKYRVALDEQDRAKFNDLVRKQTEDFQRAEKAKQEAQARTAQQRLVQIENERAKTARLFADVASAARAVDKAQTDVEHTQVLGRLSNARDQLASRGQGARADNLILQIGIDGDREAEARIAELAAAADEAARKRDIQFTAQGDAIVKARIEALIADAKRLAQTDVGIKAFLDQGEFKRQYREIQARVVELASTDAGIDVDLDTKGFDAHLIELKARLAELGLKEEHVRVVLDVDRSGFDRFIGGIEELSQEAQFRFDGLSTKIRDTAIGLAIVFAEPLLSALTAVGGALIAVGVAAGQAALGLAGLATAGIAQAIPVLGILVATISRVTAVFKAVSAAQAEKDKGAQQGAKADQQAAAAALALKNAHRGVIDAYRNVLDAQTRLNEARREGIRTIQDQVAAEQRANLTALTSRLSLAAQVGSGGGGLIQAAQLQTQSDVRDASRQRVDTRATVKGGIENLPAVTAARKAVDQANESLERAKDAVKQAETAFTNASANEGAAASALAVALGKLTDAEKTLYDSVTRFRALFEKGGAFSGVTDVLVSGFAKALDQITDLLKDPALIAAAGNLATAMSAGLLDFIHFLTTGKVREAFLFFASEAAKNIGPFTKIIESLIGIFTDVARAASGPLHDALEGVSDFLKGISDYTGSAKGQSALGKFFQDALAPISSFLKLGGAVLELFLALVGVGVGKEGTKGIDGLTKSVQNATKYVRDNGDKVREFFHDAVEAAGKLLSVVVYAGQLLVQAFDAESVKKLSDAINDVVLPALATFITTIGIVSVALLDIANNPVGAFLIKMGALFLGVNVVVSGIIRLLGPVALLFKGLRFLLGVIYETRIGAILLTAAFEGMEAVLAVLSGPVGWILLAVAALVLLLAKLGVLDDVIDWLKHHWPLVLTILTGPFGLAVTAIVKHFDDIKRIFSSAFDDIKGIVSDAAGWIVDKLKGLGGDVGGILPSPFKKAGKGAADGLISGFKTIGDFFVNIATWLFNHVIKPIYDYFEIKSPSKLMERTGKNIGEGLVNGIVGFVEGYYGALFKLGRKIVDAVVQGIRSLAGAIANALKEAATGRVEIFGHNVNPFADDDKKDDKKPPPKVSAPVAPKTSVDIGLDVGDQKKFAADWKDFWSDLVTTSQRSAARIATAFKDLRVASTDSTQKMYLDVRSNLADTQNSFQVRGDAIETAWGDAFYAISKIAYDGLFYIGHETNRALTGLGSKAINFNLTGPTHDKSEGKAGGGFAGWVGQQGERGRDAVHAVLGRGEAVLNWAHQKVVEPAMRATYGIGLSDMFKGTRALHAGQGAAYAAGGFSNAVGAHIDTPDEKEIANDLGKLGRKVGLVFAPAGPRSARRTQAENAAVDGAPNSNHLLGRAMDVIPDAIKTIANSVLNSVGLNRPMPGAWTSPTGQVHDERNHIELLNSSTAGLVQNVADVTAVAVQKVATQIGKVKVGGDTSSGLGRLLQKSLDTARTKANKKISDGTTGPGDLGDLSGFTPGSGTIKSNMSLAQRMLAASSLNAPGAWEGLKYVWGHESGFDTTVHYGGGHGYVPGLAYGIPQALPGDKMASAGSDWMTSAATQIKWGLGYIKSVYHSIAELVAHWRANSSYAGGGFVGGLKTMAWGGAQAAGGDYVVDKPTLFLAGEAGRERATFAPGGFAGSPPNVINSAPQITTGPGINTFQAVLLQALAASNFADVIAAVRGAIRTLHTYTTKTKSGLDKISSALDFATADGTSVIQKLTDATAARTARRRSTGADELTTLQQDTGGLQQTNEVVDNLTKTAKSGLAKAQAKGDTKAVQRFQGSLARLDAARTTIQQQVTNNAGLIVAQVQSVYDRIGAAIGRQQKQNTALGINDPSLIDAQIKNTQDEVVALTKELTKARKSGNTQLERQLEDQIADLNESVVELGVQRLQAVLDNINKAASDRSAATDRKFAAATTLGVRGTTQAKLAEQTTNAQSQIGQLHVLAASAIASGNTTLLKTIDDQIADLNNSIVQYASDTIQAGIDEVNKAASDALGQNDIKNSLAQLGITQDQARSGQINIAALGRPNYGAIGSSLDERGSILTSQRAGLLDQLGQASSLGDQTKIVDLTKQIGDLDVSIVQNTQAVRDNTDAAFTAAVSQSQAGNDFLLSLNQGAQGINNALGQISGVVDPIVQRQLLEQQGAEQGTTNTANRGFLGQLLASTGVNTSQLASVSGNSLVPYLQQLYTQAQASGTLDDAQIQSMKDLITAIINGEQATIDNTNAIKALDNSVAQTFSSTAWTTFRQAILNGNGGLLPTYSIPQMHGGGMVTKAGVFDLSIGERVVTPQQGGDGGVHIDEFNTNITNPTEVLDESVVGKKIAWNMAGIGKDH